MVDDVALPTPAVATLLDWVECHADQRPAAPALEIAGETVVYADLYRQVLSCAAGLRALGLKRGDVIGVQLPNTEAFVTALLAVSACGGVFQTLHLPYRAAELTQLLAHSKARMVIAQGGDGDGSPAATVMALRDRLPSLQRVVAVDQVPNGADSFSELLRHAPQPINVRPQTDDRFLLLYTSGTTSSPKGVPHAYRGFLGNAHRSAIELDIGAHDRLMSVAPMTHLYGLYVLHVGLAVGACNVLLPAFDPTTFLSVLEAAKPTGIFAAPAHFAPFVDGGLLAAHHVARTRFTCLSGSTVPPALAEAVDRVMANGRVIQLWGMSELQAGAFGRPGDPERSRLTSAGRAAPMTELRTVDEDGHVLGPDEEGELQVRGPSVFAGYLDNLEETAASFTADGWFCTGDLARIDADGYLALTGRTKEIINRGGVKYNPVDLEVLIAGHDAVSACAIVSYPDPVLGERACLCASLYPGTKLSLEDITGLLDQAGIAKFKWPERLELFDSLPLTPTRKIMRGLLRQSLAERDAAR